jgi:hypothetical protein
MNLGDQRFAIEIAESEETRIQACLSVTNPKDEPITSGPPMTRELSQIWGGDRLVNLSAIRLKS